MKQRTAFLAAFLATVLLQGYLPPPTRSDGPLRELTPLMGLADLKLRGLTYRLLDNDLVEVKQEWSGISRVFSLREPGEAAIRAWAQTRGIPILEIDPSTIDTSRFTGWYRYWTQVPLSNGFFGPLVVGDMNVNANVEVYGVYKDTTSQYIPRAYEVDSTGSISPPLYDYAVGGGIAIGFTDSDQDGLLEYVLQRGDTAIFFEQPSPNGLPVVRKFHHIMWQYPGTAIWTRVQFGRFDSDSLMDFLYRGSEPDTTRPSGFRTMTYVAEYTAGSFQRVWSTDIGRPGGEGALGGYSVGDYDRDGRMEFVASELFGSVYLYEMVGDNYYAQIWRDSLPFVNVLYQVSGDVDGDGRTEFFVGATMSDGNWTTVYETDSNNHYSPKFLFHLLSGGSLDEPTYLTTDVDGDGRLELVIFSGADLYVFKSNADNSYYLWYYKRENVKQAVQFYDFNRDGIKDFIISKAMNNGQGLRFFADVYLASSIVSVKESSPNLPVEIILRQNYPNPFNPSTTIYYSIPASMSVRVAVFDLLGRECAELLRSEQAAGEHSSQWNATGVPSGAYFYRLETPMRSVTKKLLLLK